MNLSMKELLPLVSRLADEYTGMQSTSVTYETAETLMGAVLYCIRESREAPDFDSTVSGVESCSQKNAVPADGGRIFEDAKTLYETGYRIVLSKAARAQNLYNQILPEFCAYQNQAYEDTVTKGIPQFFLRYDPKFKPQDHLLTLDYPVLKQLSDLCGVDRILAYLECVQLEQRFLNPLPKGYVDGILKSSHASSEELFINVCSAVRRSLILRLMAKAPVSGAGSDKSPIDKIKDAIQKQPRPQLEQWIDELSRTLVERNYDGDARMAAYLALDTADFAFDLKRRADSRS